MKKAVLVIHGLAGGTYDQEDLSNYLQLDSKLDVFTFTLPGHGASRKAAKATEWIKSSRSQMDFLIENGYKEIYLIGHSMGGVIASHLATQYDEVKKVVLAAPAFQYLKEKDGKFDVMDSIKLLPKFKETYEMDQIMSRILKLPLSSVSEFLALVNKYKDSVKDIKVPILIIQGLEDLMVPFDSSKKVYDSIDTNVKKLVFVKGIGHDTFQCKRKKELIKMVHHFLRIKRYKNEQEEITI